MNKTLAIVAMVAATVLAAGVFTISTQSAYADSSSTSFSFKQKQSNNCTGFSSCSNDGTITFGRGAVG